MSDTIRTFIAIELPDPIISFLKKIQEGLRPYGFKVRWVKPENIHLTLKFLGDIHAGDVQKVGAAISESIREYAAISLSAKGIGTFPGIKRPRVIWVGITGQQNELSGLQKRLDHDLSTIGFEKEKRRFKGHLTLGRAKGKIDARQMMDTIVACGGFTSDVFSVRNITFFQSHLQKAGAVYTRIMGAPLVEHTKQGEDL